MSDRALKAKQKYFYIGLLGLIAFVTATIVLLGEWKIRRSAQFYNYWEMNHLPQTPQVQSEPWLWTYRPNINWTHSPREFSQKIRTNADGLPWPPLAKKRQGEPLVIAIGDSYTHGIGDTEGGGFPAALERHWNSERPKKRARVINAGIAGSDPVFSMWLLDQRLLRLNPDIVILAINSSDVDDLINRGGFNGRFESNGYLRTDRLPWWAPLFNVSHLVRAFVLGVIQYDWNLVSSLEQRKRKKIAVQDIAYAAQWLKELGKKHNFRTLTVFLPTSVDFRLKVLRPELLDVMGVLKNEEVDFIDLTPIFSSALDPKDWEQYYWRYDSHYKPKGYDLVGKLLLKEIDKRGWRNSLH